MERLTVIVWVTWLLSVIVSFSILEGTAIVTGKWWTLSHFTWEAARAFPLILVFYGMVFGGLAVHFFWTNQGLGSQ